LICENLRASAAKKQLFDFQDLSITRFTSERLNSQHLRGVPFDTPEDALRHFGAVQSQDYAAG